MIFMKFVPGGGEEVRPARHLGAERGSQPARGAAHGGTGMGFFLVVAIAFLYVQWTLLVSKF